MQGALNTDLSPRSWAPTRRHDVEAHVRRHPEARVLHAVGVHAEGFAALPLAACRRRLARLVVDLVLLGGAAAVLMGTLQREPVRPLRAA